MSLTDSAGGYKGSCYVEASIEFLMDSGADSEILRLLADAKQVLEHLRAVADPGGSLTIGVH